MGDPRKTRKKYETPMHPWIAGRIEDEKAVTQKFGTKNKKEIWRMVSALKRFKDQAKLLFGLTSKQSDLEREQMMNKMVGLGLINPGATLDDILSLSLDDMMSRRLQTIMVKRLLARTTKQARQLITHGHVMAGGKVITSPSYLVTVAEESNLSFRASSPFNNDQHPERFSEAELNAQAERTKAKAAKKSDTEEEIQPPAYTAEQIADPEELGKIKAKAETKVKAEAKTEDKPSEKKDDKPAAETPAENKEKKAVENAPEKKAKAPAKKKDEKPAKKTEEKPVEKPVEEAKEEKAEVKAEEKKEEKPAEKKEEKAAEEKPAEKLAVEKPAPEVKKEDAPEKKEGDA